jgi:ABC-type glycerol-3-phosphate transport system substrate-binding protein
MEDTTKHTGARAALTRRGATRRAAMAGASGGLALWLAACGAEQQTAAPKSQALAPADLEFHYHWAQNSPGETGWMKVAEKFAAATPGVKVNLVRHGGFEKVIAAISAGTPPNLIDLSPAQYASLAPRNVLVKLDPMLKRADRLKATDLVPAIQEQATLGGSISALPSEAGASIVFLNLDLIEEAGIKPPDKSWRWSGEFLDIARRVSRDGPRSRCAAASSTSTTAGG